MAFFYGLGLALFDLRIEGFSLSEIISVLFISYVVLERKRISRKIPTSLFFFLLITFLSLPELLGRDYFLQSSFLNNVLRLGFYTIGFIVIPKYLQARSKTKQLLNGITVIIQICCILVVIEFCLKNLLGFTSWTLWQIPNVSLGYGTVFDNVRSRAFFSEPAHLAIFTGISTLVYIRYYAGSYKPKSYYKVIACCFVILTLCLSLSGYIFLLLILAALFHDLFKSKRVSGTKKVSILFMALIFGFTFFVSMSVSGLLDDKIIGRIQRISSGADRSAQHRLLGQFELVSNAMKQYPLNGIGFGQNLAYLESNSFQFTDFFFMKGVSTGSGINNILVYVLLQMGIFGLLCFLWFVYNIFGFDYFLLTGFLLMSFSWGYFNSPFLWFLFYMGRTIQLETR